LREYEATETQRFLGYYAAAAAGSAIPLARANAVVERRDRESVAVPEAAGRPLP
jgi:hypothetical protein